MLLLGALSAIYKSESDEALSHVHPRAHSLPMYSMSVYFPMLPQIVHRQSAVLALACSCPAGINEGRSCTRPKSSPSAETPAHGQVCSIIEMLSGICHVKHMCRSCPGGPFLSARHFDPALLSEGGDFGRFRDRVSRVLAPVVDLVDACPHRWKITGGVDGVLNDGVPGPFCCLVLRQ